MFRIGKWTKAQGKAGGTVVGVVIALTLMTLCGCEDLGAAHPRGDAPDPPIAELGPPAPRKDAKRLRLNDRTFGSISGFERLARDTIEGVRDGEIDPLSRNDQATLEARLNALDPDARKPNTPAPPPSRAEMMDRFLN